MEPPPPPPPVTGDVYLVSRLSVGQADLRGDLDVVPGMNLDGFVSGTMEPAGCGHADFTSPPPYEEEGVDNQLGPILDAFGLALDIDDLYAAGIRAGSLLILVEVQEDEVAIYRGQIDDVLLSSAGRPAPGQTFTIAERWGRMPLTEAADELRASGAVGFPIHPFGVDDAVLEPAQLYATMSDGMLVDGVLGGGYLTDVVAEGLAATFPSLASSIFDSVANAQADLDIDGGVEGCERISVAFTFEAVAARVE
jgi:hypothetical protein